MTRRRRTRGRETAEDINFPLNISSGGGRSSGLDDVGVLVDLACGESGSKLFRLSFQGNQLEHFVLRAFLQERIFPCISAGPQKITGWRSPKLTASFTLENPDLESRRRANQLFFLRGCFVSEAIAKEKGFVARRCQFYCVAKGCRCGGSYSE